MPIKLTRDAYAKLIEDNIAWLKKATLHHDVLEFKHIVSVLRQSVQSEYPVTPMTVEEFDKLEAPSPMSDVWLHIRAALVQNEERQQWLVECHSDFNGADTKPPIDEQFNEPTDTSSLQSLRRWVNTMQEHCKKEGSLFDTGFRCVSEGGEVFYFDPEEVTKLMDEHDEAVQLLWLLVERNAAHRSNDQLADLLRAMDVRVKKYLERIDKRGG